MTKKALQWFFTGSAYKDMFFVLVVLGLITVWEHLRLLSVGYEVNDLRGRRDRLAEEVRVLERRIDAAATPSAAAERVRTLDIGLAPPRERATGDPAARRRP